MTKLEECKCGHDIKYHSSKDGCHYGMLNDCMCDHFQDNIMGEK